MAKKGTFTTAIRLDLRGTRHRIDEGMLTLEFDTVPLPTDEIALVVEAMELSASEARKLTEVLSSTLWDFSVDQMILSRIRRDA